MIDPEAWTKVDGIPRIDANEFTDEFANELGQMSGRCLDVGSGPGDVTVDFILPKLNPKATLVCSDKFEGMVNFAKEKYKNNHRLSFLKQDIETPKLPKNLIEQFNHVTSFYCLHWCQDMRQVFQNFFDLLRPGGTVLLISLADIPIWNAFETLAAMPRYQPYMMNVQARSIPPFWHAEDPRETLEALLRGVGFEIIHFSERERKYTFDTPDDLSAFLMSVREFVEQMPTDVREEYRRDLIKEFSSRCVKINKNNSNENEYSTLLTYRSFVMYFKKPEAE